MSSTTALQVQQYVDRIADIFTNDPSIFPPETTGESLVTAVIKNKPAIEQSSDEGIIPYILVFESTQPIRFMEKAGRDTKSIEGGAVYEVEIYCVAIVGGQINTQETQEKLRIITQAMRDALGRNLRLADPTNLELDPLCRTHTRFEIPYLLRGQQPDMMAKNVVVRAQVYLSLRSNP